MSIMEKTRRQELKEKAKLVRKQNKEFRERSNALFEKKFRASLHYEETMVRDDGKAYINVDLTKVKSPFSIYSYEKRMDPEIYNYIESQVYYLRASVPIVINFDDGGKYSQELKDKIAKHVKRYFTLEYEDKRLEHFKSLFFGTLLAIIGVAILALYIFLSATLLKDNNIFIEIICILSWVFIWQSADAFFFSGHQRRVDIYNSAQLALAEITFGKSTFGNK